QLQEHFFHKLPIYRKIKSVREQNDWFAAADKPELSPFIKTPLQQLPRLPSPFQYGEVKQTYWLDTGKLIQSYTRFLIKRNALWKTTFRYTDLTLHSDHIQYRDLKFRKVICCEGIHLQQNPFFP